MLTVFLNALMYWLDDHPDSYLNYSLHQALLISWVDSTKEKKMHKILTATEIDMFTKLCYLK